jgi:iron complex outermembrane receptor protein
LGTWFGRAQRSGGLTERFINYFPVGLDPYELVGNPFLLPEINHQLDVTFEWVGPKSKINIDLFASYLKDFISSYIDTDLNPRLPMSPGVRRYINIEKAYKTGLEFNWSQELSAQFKHQMGIAYTIAQDVEREEPLPEIAPLDIRYTLMGNHLKGKLQTEVSFRHVLEQSRVSKEYGETTSPSFSLVDATIGYSIYENTRLSAGVNNLLNRSYNEHLNRSVRGTNEPILAPGRNLFASLNINF